MRKGAIIRRGPSRPRHCGERRALLGAPTDAQPPGGSTQREGVQFEHEGAGHRPANEGDGSDILAP